MKLMSNTFIPIDVPAAGDTGTANTIRGRQDLGLVTIAPVVLPSGRC